MLEKLRSRIKSAPAPAARRGRAVRKKLRRFMPDKRPAWIGKTAKWITSNFLTIIGCLVVTLAALAVVMGIREAYFAECMFDACIIAKVEGKITITEWLTFTGSVTAFIGSLTGLILLNKRTRNQDRQIKLQIDKEIDDRFTVAVNLLGSGETSARTGAVYSLYQLAVESDKYRNQVVQILCSHIRSKTQEKDYPENHTARPSNEIQTTIDLLFKHENKLEGIYHKGFSGLPHPNLSHAYLVGADFTSAQCQGADFRKAQCQRANFGEAQCQGADFRKAQCQRANFGEAQCQGADFSAAQCQGADFSDAQCQGASFRRAQCQGAYFSDAQCQGANFWRAQCKGAYFVSAQCQGANFWRAQCKGAYFVSAQCQGATFSDAQCQGADFSDAQCQGTSFRRAQCQGADFRRAQFQSADLKDANFKGAHSAGEYLTLSERIGKNTDLSGAVFSGELDEETIQAIENAKAFLSDYWYQEMQEIINASKGKSVNAGVDTSNRELKKQLGIITGKLEDSEEIQRIIREIEGE